jgi:hypothetical protein
MDEMAERDGVTSLVFRHERAVPDDGIIRIVENGCAAQSTAHACAPLSR